MDEIEAGGPHHPRGDWTADTEQRNGCEDAAHLSKSGTGGGIALNQKLSRGPKRMVRSSTPSRPPPAKPVPTARSARPRCRPGRVGSGAGPRSGKGCRARCAPPACSATGAFAIWRPCARCPGRCGPEAVPPAAVAFASTATRRRSRSRAWRFTRGTSFTPTRTARLSFRRSGCRTSWKPRRRSRRTRRRCSPCSRTRPSGWRSFMRSTPAR
jgi:hypothetical protein